MPRARTPGRAAGFTLIEVLVVVFVLGVALAAVGLRVGDGGRRDRLEQSAQRLRAVLELAAQEAVLRGTWLAASLDAEGYQVLTLRGRQWVPAAAGEPFAPQRLPRTVRLALSVEGKGQWLPQPGEPAPAQIFFTPEGEITRFELWLSDRGLRERWRLRAELVGRVALEHDSGAL